MALSPRAVTAYIVASPVRAPVKHTVARRCVLALLGISLGCDRFPPPRSESPSLTATASVDVAQTFSLGADTSEAPGEVKFTAVSDSLLSIVDQPRRRISTFDFRGRLKWSVRYGAGEEASVVQPTSLVWHRDTLYVADVDARRGILALDINGALLWKNVIPFARPVTSVGRLSGRFVLATTSSDSLLASGAAPLVHVFDADGEKRASGCIADPVYMSAAKRGGMMSVFRAMTVVVAKEGVYCAQPLSRSIQLLDTTLALHRRISLEPFLRKRTPDARMSMDLISINRFRQTLTEVGELFLSPRFVHVRLVNYDSASAVDRYAIVRCSRDEAARCSSAATPGMVLAALNDDSVLVLMPRRSVAEPPSVSVFEYADRTVP